MVITAWVCRASCSGCPWIRCGTRSGHTSPRRGESSYARQRHACVFHDVVDLREQPVTADGPVAEGNFGILEARRLDHSIDAVGYRLVEPDGRHFVPELLAYHGIAGPAVGELRRAGSISVGGRIVRLPDVSEPRRGQRFAFVMDTRLCDAAYALADGADLLVIEATFLTQDAELADRYGHLTARQAAQVAADCGVRRLVLTHFSPRYADTTRYLDEAAEVFAGDIVVAEDLARVPVPKRP